MTGTQSARKRQNGQPALAARPIAKLSRPRLAEHYARERLFDALDRARARPVVFITGPPGAGKTTLVASYLAARALPGLWYQIDDGDEDIATFFYYLGLADRQAHPRKRKPLPLFTAEYRGGAVTFARNFFTQLFERLPSPAVVVFDNYQEVAGDSALQAVMQAGLEAIPAGCQVVLISRHTPPPALARYRANERMALIGWSELQLTEDEARGIVALRQVEGEAASLASRGLARTQGWVAGLILLLEWLQTEAAEPEALSGFAPEAVFNYFAGELLDKVAPAERAFLVRSALLPKMTGSMAAELTGHGNAEAILADLHRRNLFTTRYTNHSRTYQYHPLLRKFLLTRAKQELASDELVRLRGRAARLLAEEGRIEAAVELLIDGRDWPGVADLVNAHADALLAQGRGQTLSEWIEALPEAVRERDPWLLHWLGHARMGMDPQQSLPCFEQALARFRETEDVAGIYLAWCGAVESIRFDWGGSHRRYDHWVAVFDELQQAFPEFPSAEIELKAALAIDMALVWRVRSHSKRAYWRERVLVLAGTQGDVSVKIDAFGRSLQWEFCYGDCARAAMTYGALRDLLAKHDPSPLAHTSALTMIAVYYIRLGRLAECREVCAQGLDIARRSGSHHADFFLLFFGGQAALLAGDADDCAATLSTMSTMPGARGAHGAHFYHQLAMAHALASGNAPLAKLHSTQAIKAAEDSGSPFFENFAKAAAVCVRLDDYPAAATAQAEEALEQARAMDSYWLEWAALCYRAYAALYAGEEEAAESKLREAFALGREQDIVATPGTFSKPWQVLCQRALEAGIEVDYTKGVIRALALVPDATSLEVEHWPWAVKIYTLGRFEVLCDDLPFKFSRKEPKKPLQLLKALIALGGKGVSQSRLADTLWPDTEGDAGRRALDTNLHRLRKLLGEETVTLTGGQLTLDSSRCWVDAWAFDHLLGEVEDEGQADEQAAWSRRGERALTLYQGQFLAGEPQAPWSEPLRQRLRQRFIRATVDLAKHMEAAGEWERALQGYRRGLEVEDLAEGFYQGLIRCQAELGSPSEALDTYYRLKRHLAITLGAKPSAATERLRRSVCVG